MVLNLLSNLRERAFSMSPKAPTQVPTAEAKHENNNQQVDDVTLYEEDEVKEISHDLIEISLATDDETPPYDAETIDALIEYAKDGNLVAFQRICERLRTKSLNADAPGFLGWTPAHWAAREGHVHILVYLESIHANLDRVDRKGDSLLHKAASNGQFRVCQWLLEHGFNVQAKNHHQKTPLDLAREHVEVTKSSDAVLTETILAREFAHTF